jgi:hypothetical protein
MTHLEALKDLKAKVEAGGFTPEPGGSVMPSYRSFVALADIALPQDLRALNVLAHDAYKGSLDAALRLHEAVLPGWDATLSIGACHVSLSESIGSNPVRGWYPGPECSADTPARAWLLAVLSALIAQEEQP